jgi:hypothetical protein
MHQSLTNTLDYIEIPPRNRAETKHVSALWLVVRRSQPDYAV